MKCLFVHDHVFILKEREIYSSGVLSNNVFDRYLNWSNDLKIMARSRLANDSDSVYVNETNRVKNVRFEPLPDFWKPQTLKKTFRNLKRSINDVDCVIVQIPSIYGIIAGHYALKMNKPLLIEVVGDTYDAFRYHGRVGWSIAPILTFLTRRIIKNANHVRYVTDTYLQKRYPSDGIKAGYSDVSLEEMPQDYLNKRLQKINTCDPKQLILGTIGPIDIRYKGQHTVFEALAFLKKKGMNFEYHLVGKGDNTVLKKLAQSLGILDSIRFIGVLNRQEIVTYLDSLDVYIQPSQTEGLPRAIIEAMNQGCPVLGSKVGGIPELIHEACTFPYGDVKAIVTVLESLDKPFLTQEATQNFTFSKNYMPHVLKRKDEMTLASFFNGVTHD